MNYLTKLVAGLLVTLFVGVPLSALGSCLTESPVASHCPEDCPMMRGQAAGPKLESAQGTSMTCCEMHSAVPQNKVSWEAPKTSTVVLAAPPVSAGPAAASAVAIDAVELPTAPASMAPQQALLCTFLI